MINAADYTPPTDTQYFTYLIGEKVKLGKAYHNPLREDKNAGCSFYVTQNGTLLFSDFAKGRTYTWQQFAMEK